MPASTQPAAHLIHAASRGVNPGQAIHLLLTLRMAAGDRKARESFLLALLAMALFHPASATVGACRRMRAAFISKEPTGEAVCPHPAALATPTREEGFAHFGAAGLEKSQESRGKNVPFESISATRPGKLQRYLEQLDADSRSNLERHLRDPGVSSSAICDSLRAHGFIIGRTSVTDYRRKPATRAS